MTIRKPVAAGTYYPAEKKELEKQINFFLSRVKKIKTKDNLRLLIVPHAGYIYSGQTAAWGYRQIEGKKYKRVVLIGNSHHLFFNKAVIADGITWQTSLGQIEIDNHLVDKLTKQSLFFEVNNTPHLPEQILEIQLPFLQKVISSFEIIPILLSQSSEERIDNLALSIVKFFDEESLLVISSDLSHYPPYEIANEVDRQTIQAILSGDPDHFSRTVRKLESSGYPGLQTTACSGEAIRMALKISQKLGIDGIKLLNYRNSGDISGDFSQVVGYASIGFYQSHGAAPGKI